MKAIYSLNTSVVSRTGQKPDFGTGLDWADKSDWQKLCSRELTYGFQNTESDLHTIAVAIYRGYTITTHHTGGPECQRLGCEGRKCIWKLHRCNANFLEGQIIAADFDDLEDLSDVTSNYLVEKHAFFVYTTPSHKPEKPRARALFALSEPVTTGEQFRLLNRGLQHYFDGKIDLSTTDYCRLWYGCKNSELHTFQDVTLPIELALQWAERYQASLPAPVEHIAPPSYLPARRKPDHSKYLQAMIDRAKYEVSTAGVGDRHRVLLSNLAMLQSYINGGELDSRVLDEIEACYPASARGDGPLAIAYVRRTVTESKTVRDNSFDRAHKLSKQWGVE